MVKKIKKENKIKKMRTLNVDKISLKKKIKQKLYQNIEGYSETNLLKKEFDYSQEYSKYIREEFNSKIINMIIIYLNKKRNSKDFPEAFKKEPGFINKFISLVKYLLLNELEVAALTLLIDNLGWKNEKIKVHWDYFCSLGIKAKQIIRSEDMSLNLLNKVSSTNSIFMDNYMELVNDEEVSKKLQTLINLKAINEAYKKLTRPINSYCRKNFINYNGVVDNIIKLTQPYGENSNGNEIKINEDWERIKPEENLKNSKEGENQNNFGINNSLLNDVNCKRGTTINYFNQNIYSADKFKEDNNHGSLLMPILVSQSNGQLMSPMYNSFKSGVFNMSKNSLHSFSIQGSNVSFT